MNVNIKPTENQRDYTESALRKKWIEMINATNPSDTVVDDRTVWGTGTKVDVYRKTHDGRIIIYELKAGAASPIDLYQLKMYWDGLVLQGDCPDEGILLCENLSAANEEMANQMNKLTPPKGSHDYRFLIEKHEDKNLL
ncbi:MAG: hypothetical protein O2913_09740 [Chloroflexi bacterium]|nr:hypothetical protein [Chloroflexota bacterium]